MAENTKPKILWIDDAFCKKLHELMAYVDELEGSEGGFTVIKASDPDKMLIRLENGNEEFACFILDIMLPYGDRITAADAQNGNCTGIVLKEKILQLDRYKNVPVVMLTGVRRTEKIVIEYCKNNICFFKADISATDFLKEIKKLTN